MKKLFTLLAVLFLSLPTFARGESTLYFFNNTQSKLYSTRKDGSNVSLIDTGKALPEKVKIDSINNKVIFLSGTKIYRVN